MMPSQPLDNPFLQEEPIPDRDRDFQFSRTSRQAEGARCALDMTRLRVQIRLLSGKLRTITTNGLCQIWGNKQTHHYATQRFYSCQSVIQNKIVLRSHDTNANKIWQAKIID